MLSKLFDLRLGHLQESTVFVCDLFRVSFSSCYKFPFHTHEQNYPWRMCEVSVLCSESHSCAVTLEGMLILL